MNTKFASQLVDACVVLMVVAGLCAMGIWHPAIAAAIAPCVADILIAYFGKPPQTEDAR